MAWPLQWAFLACALPCFGLPALAQNSQPPIPVPQLDPGTLGQPGFRFAGGVPQVVNLIAHGDGARTGHLWIGNTGPSLRIVGEVDGNAPDWPRDRDSILEKDHAEVWLAGAADVELPPIGWGDQDGPNELDSDQGCSATDPRQDPSKNAAAQEKCRRWFDTQQKYRPLFKRLFVRQWLLASGVSMESYATPAYGIVSSKYAVTKYAGTQLAVLEPHGDVSFRAETRAGKPGYVFEIDIPYSSFPPLNTLQLSELRLLVDVFSAAPQGKGYGPFSSTSATRAYGKLDTFNLLHLDPARVFDLSPCGDKLQGTDIYRNMQPAWFIPKVTSDHPYQADAFLIVNETHGYQYEPGDTVSPTVRPVHFFWQGISAGEWVCGPQLTYRTGNTIREFGDGASEEGFDARRTTDGKIMIKEGPEVWLSEFGSGQCGACPRMQLEILALDSNLNLITLLDLGDTIGGPLEFSSSGEMTVSPGWSQVVEYGQDETQTWSSVTYCLKSGFYTECGRKVGVKPPDPPVIRQKLFSHSSE
jgi:hypothetical protein